MVKTTLDEVWEKGQVIDNGTDPKVWRTDIYGNEIVYRNYGRKGQTGWEIAYKFPIKDGGAKNVKNMVPVHWSVKERFLGNNEHEATDMKTVITDELVQKAKEIIDKNIKEGKEPFPVAHQYIHPSTNKKFVFVTDGAVRKTSVLAEENDTVFVGVPAAL